MEIAILNNKETDIIIQSAIWNMKFIKFEIIFIYLFILCYSIDLYISIQNY